MADTSTAARNFDRVMNALGLLPQAEVWRADWPVFQETFPTTGVPFLQREIMTATCDQLRISSEVRDALLASLLPFERNECLQRVAWHCHHAFFKPVAGKAPQVYSWPAMPSALGVAADFFYALVYLSGVSNVMTLNRKHGIPDAITLDTLSDLEVWILDHKQRHGRLGFAQKGWLSLHFSGRIFKLGRLQFIPEHFRYQYHAFRHRSDRRVVLLAGDQMRFRQDGQFDGATGVVDKAAAWSSVYREDEFVITGNPISPEGKALPSPRTLPRQEWESILQPDDPVLGVHIAATGPMTFSECGQSFQRAMEFFPRHFPERSFRAFTCSSWLLDDQLGAYLPPASNIVRFQREWYLHPVPNANDFQIFERVFGSKPEDPDAAPQDTSVRRAVIQHLKSGGHWRTGGGVLFPDDLSWGAQVYRKVKA